jgi:hypothetical protein
LRRRARHLPPTAGGVGIHGASIMRLVVAGGTGGAIRACAWGPEPGGNCEHTVATVSNDNRMSLWDLRDPWEPQRASSMIVNLAVTIVNPVATTAGRLHAAPAPPALMRLGALPSCTRARARIRPRQGRRF